MRLADVIDVFIAGDWGNESPSEETPNAVYCVRGADIVPISIGEFGDIPLRYVSDKSFEEKTLRAGDMIVEKSGGSPTQSTGRVSYVSEALITEKRAVVCTNFCVAFRVKTGWNPYFVYQYWNHIYNNNIFFNFEGKTSGLKNLQLDNALKAIEIPDYTLEQQNRIAETLLKIEQKVLLNRAINHNLEQQAQALFKSWFVDFEPFRGGEFVDSELGLIPKGWRVVSLGEVTKQITEKVGNREDVTVLSPINSGELVLSEEYFTKQVFSKDLSKYLIVNPLSFAYNPARINIGSIGLNTFDFVGCVSPVYVVFECEPNYQYFFDFFKRTAMFKDEVALRAIGGVRQSLGYNDLSLIKIIYPTSDVVVEFNNLYLKMKEVMIKNTDQNEKFISLRDSLLPKLMSGELKINEFNC